MYINTPLLREHMGKRLTHKLMLFFLKATTQVRHHGPTCLLRDRVMSHCDASGTMSRKSRASVTTARLGTVRYKKKNYYPRSYYYSAGPNYVSQAWLSSRQTSKFNT